jgi:hypothetical protein
MTLHLTRSSRLWIFQLLGFEVSSPVTKKATSTVSIDIDFRPLEGKEKLLSSWWLWNFLSFTIPSAKKQRLKCFFGENIGFSKDSRSINLTVLKICMRIVLSSND